MDARVLSLAIRTSFSLPGTKTQVGLKKEWSLVRTCFQLMFMWSVSKLLPVVVSYGVFRWPKVIEVVEWVDFHARLVAVTTDGQEICVPSHQGTVPHKVPTVQRTSHHPSTGKPKRKTNTFHKQTFKGKAVKNYQKKICSLSIPTKSTYLSKYSMVCPCSLSRPPLTKITPLVWDFDIVDICRGKLNFISSEATQEVAPGERM